MPTHDIIDNRHKKARQGEKTRKTMSETRPFLPADLPIANV
jgi:hypothetical protein